jgi:hypothetical protein
MDSKQVKNLLILFCLAALLIGYAIMAQAAPSYDTMGNPGDVRAGTVISSPATFEVLNYLDPNGSQMPTVEPPVAWVHVVTSEYGYSGPGSPTDLSVAPGDIVTHDYLVTHEGNVTDEGYRTTSWYGHFNTASGWTVEAWVGDPPTFFKTLEAGVASTETGTFNNDSDSSLRYRVIIPTEVSKVANGSYIILVTTFETTNTPVGKYTGGNYLTYSGWGLASDEVKDQVEAPILTLTRTASVDAPFKYQGGRHDAVPGSAIKFTMTYSNEGGGSAEGVVLVDKIPNYYVAGISGGTRLAHVNVKGPTTNVTIEGGQGNGVGWTVKYSTLESPDKTYGVGSPTWELIGVLTTGGEMFPGSGLLYVPGDVTYEARWIKWEKPSIDTTEDTKILTWGVTIR